MPSEAQKKATDNFYKKNKQLNITISNEVYELFVNYCKEKELDKTKREILEDAIQYYIDNH
jgi:hypothetical protein|nr:MAG TPA: hypothetical protein [Caudoviricetes sp.]